MNGIVRSMMGEEKYCGKKLWLAKVRLLVERMVEVEEQSWEVLKGSTNTRRRKIGSSHRKVGSTNTRRRKIGSSHRKVQGCRNKWRGWGSSVKLEECSFKGDTRFKFSIFLTR